MSGQEQGVFFWHSRDLRLAAREWPAAAPRALVVLVPGWGSHAGRHAGLAKALNGGGYSVASLDFEGHGRSPGARAVVVLYEHLLQDLREFLGVIARRLPGLPVFLCGHSLGGNLALRVAAEPPGPDRPELAGLVLHGAALRVSPRIPRLRIRLARALGRVWPSLPLMRLTSGARMSRRPESAQAYEADALIHHGRLRAGTGLELLRANLSLAPHFQRVTVPLLILQGGADEIVDPDGAQALMDAAPSSDKTLKVWPEARHDLFNEVEAPDVESAPGCAVHHGDLMRWLAHKSLCQGTEWPDDGRSECQPGGCLGPCPSTPPGSPALLLGAGGWLGAALLTQVLGAGHSRVGAWMRRPMGSTLRGLVPVLDGDLLPPADGSASPWAGACAYLVLEREFRAGLTGAARNAAFAQANRCDRTAAPGPAAARPGGDALVGDLAACPQQPARGAAAWLDRCFAYGPTVMNRR